MPGRTLLEDGELWLERGEHVSLVGPNGAGKTTLIEALAGRRELDGGQAPHRPQRAARLPLPARRGARLAGTVLEAAQRATGLTPNKARALLGRFLFSGEEAEKPMDGLSGGERRRLSLAILVASGANVLILDEPTNHLDIDAREALEDALSAFDGTVLLVSHDRALLDAVGTRTFAIEDGRLRSYLGGWAEYSRVREERREAEASAKRDKRAAASPKAAKPTANGRAKPAGPSKNAVKRAAELEREVEKAEAALRALEDELADPSAWASPTSSERATAAPRGGEEGRRGGLRPLGGPRLAAPNAAGCRARPGRGRRSGAAPGSPSGLTGVAGGPRRERRRRHRIGGQLSIQLRAGRRRASPLRLAAWTIRRSTPGSSNRPGLKPSRANCALM